MTYNELNNYILNYVEKDKTGRAIMLTGEWGSGKSYYIKNTLKPFLEDADSGEHKCVIVSLYGFTDLSEISKAIYMELRTIKKETISETGTITKTVGKIVGKTIFNGLVSMLGFDIGNISENDLQKVYESINLDNKLIVLEDMERTQIDIVNLLGYINNMCENDNVKILLVANEEEILSFHIEDVDGIKTISKRKIYSEKAKKYLKAKEKTISDTPRFHCNYDETVESIIKSFNNNELSKCKECIKSQKRSMTYRTTLSNFREFIVACQKACDIFCFMEKNQISSDDEFKRCIVVGLVYYLQKRLHENEINFKSNTLFDTELSGSDIYPLMKFCFNYYNLHILNKDEICQTINEYREYLIYVDKTEYNDIDLKILYGLFYHSEKEINEAIKQIFMRLSDINDISLSHYDRIINYLLIFKYDANSTNQTIDRIIDKIIDNLKGRGEKFTQKSHLFASTLEIQNEEGARKFNEIKAKVFEALAYFPNTNSLLSLNYAETISKISNEDITPENFNKLMEILSFDDLIQNIVEFTSETMDNLRHIFLSINYTQLTADSLSIIQTFKNKIKSLCS